MLIESDRKCSYPTSTPHPRAGLELPDAMWGKCLGCVWGSWRDGHDLSSTCPTHLQADDVIVEQCGCGGRRGALESGEGLVQFSEMWLG